MNYFEQFMKKRGLTEAALKDLFSYEKIYIKGTDEACELIHSLPKDAKIRIITDYDTDGGCSGVEDFAGFHLAGFTNVLIARRHIEQGYEFTISDINGLGEADLIFTSDVGIACFDALKYAKSRGSKIIVTDHHMPVNKDNNIFLPEADVIVDWVLDGDFKEKNADVCGAYTVYQLFARYFELYGDEYPNLFDIQSDLLMLRHFAAVATVADSMPLIGQNHEIVADMLHFYNYINPMDGSDSIVKGVCNDGVIQNIYNNLHVFIDACTDQYYTEFNMRFLEYGVIPVINTIKRMHDDPSRFYTMLFGTPSQAAEDADYLVQLNTTRKLTVNDLFQRVFVEHIDQPYKDLIYMASAPSGILGLLAIKIMNETNLPTIVLSNELRFDDELGEWVYDGSTRSPQWYPLFSRGNASGYAVCRGHQHACAITIPASKLPMFYQFLQREIEEYGGAAEKPVSRQEIIDSFDVILDYDENFFNFVPDVTDFMFDMKRIAPFGQGFPEPTIMLKFKKDLGAFTSLKDGQHTKITLAPDFQVLMWNTSQDVVDASTIDDEVYVKGYLADSYFQGNHFIDFVAKPVFTGNEII